MCKCLGDNRAADDIVGEDLSVSRLLWLLSSVDLRRLYVDSELPRNTKLSGFSNLNISCNSKFTINMNNSIFHQQTNNLWFYTHEQVTVNQDTNSCSICFMHYTLYEVICINKVYFIFHYWHIDSNDNICYFFRRRKEEFHDTPNASFRR